MPDYSIQRAARLCGFMLGLLAVPLMARADLVIFVAGQHPQANTPNQPVDVYVANAGASAVLIAGARLNAQFTDSGPAPGLGITPGPVITSADLLTGTLFAGNNTGQRDPGSAPQLAARSTTVATTPVTVSGETVNVSVPVSLRAGGLALLAKLIVDTTGFSSAEDLQLKLAATASGSTTLYDTNGAPLAATISPTPLAVIRGRYVFYNNSKFDGNNTAANSSDDNAVASDKSALLPGQTGTFANYTSYNKGINGIMLDVAGLSGALSASDFQFKVGNSANPSTWAAAPAPTSVSLRAGAGSQGSTRVTILWTDGAIQKQWLQVTLLANANSGLPVADVFYFGNAVGESGNSTANAAVTAADELRARNEQTLTAPVTSLYDYNRDGKVTAGDQLIARNNQAVGSGALQLITVP